MRKPRQSKNRSAARRPVATNPRRATVIALCIAGVAALASVLIAWKILGLIPHVSDELAYDFQARIFASGHLALTPPDPAPAFDLQHIIMKDGQWLSIYPPGWPLLLVPGVWLHVPWLISPVILFLSVLGVFTLARELYDDATALAAGILFTASPFVLLSGAGRMSHLPTLCLAVWCTVFLIRGSRSGSGRALVFAGALGGAAWLVRQLSATALLAPVVAWCLWQMRGRRAWVGGLIRLAAGAAPFILFLVAFNWLLFGSPFLTGYLVKYPTARFNGVEAYIPYAELFTRNLRSYFTDTNHRLWGFPWPDLLLLTPLLRPASGRKKDALLLAGVLALVIVHSFYFWYDIVYSGPRMVFEAMGFLAILAARGVLEAAGWFKGITAQLPRRARIGVATLAAVAALAVPVTLRLPAGLRYHANYYHGQSGDAMQALNKAGMGPNALVLVSGPSFSYGSFFPSNSLDPARGDRVFVRDIETLRAEIFKRYPRREIWQVTIDLAPIPGPNSYVDSFRMRQIVWRRAFPPS